MEGGLGSSDRPSERGRSGGPTEWVGDLRGEHGAQGISALSDVAKSATWPDPYSPSSIAGGLEYPPIPVEEADRAVPDVVTRVGTYDAAPVEHRGFLGRSSTDRPRDVPSIRIAPAGFADVHRSGLGMGAVTSARFDECLAVVVGRRSHLEVHSLYSIDRIHVDVEDVTRGLSSSATLALRAVVEDPESVARCRAFQASLRPAPPVRPPGGPPGTERRAATPLDISVIRCPVAVVGDDNAVHISPTSTVPSVDLPFGELLATDLDLVQALGRHLRRPDEPRLERDLTTALRHAVTPERLRSLLDGVDFDGTAARAHHGWRSIDVRGAAAVLGEGNTCRTSIGIRVRTVTAADLDALLSAVDAWTGPAGTPPSGREIGGLDDLLAQQSSLRLELIEANRRRNDEVVAAVGRERLRRRRLVAEVERLRALERADGGGSS